MRVYLKRGNIVQEHVTAIVNPANSTGSMASGIGAAIKNIGSANIEQDAKRQAPIALGTAIVTPGHKLQASFVIHAPTTARIVEEATIENIRRATQAALQCADAHRFPSIAFPGMGNSIGQVKKDAVAATMVTVIKEFSAQHVHEVVLIPQDSEMEAAFHKALQKG